MREKWTERGFTTAGVAVFVGLINSLTIQSTVVGVAAFLVIASIAAVALGRAFVNAWRN